MAELSSSEWLSRLLDIFSIVVPERAAHQALYEGKQPQVQVLDRYKDAYRRLLSNARTPWGRLVVDIVSERLTVIGFRGDQDESELWELMRANRMESMQKQIHREALALGTSYASVWPDENDTSVPIVRYESGLTVAHETMPGDPHTVAAAVKVWYDSLTKMYRSNLYLPDRIVKFRSKDQVDNPAQWLASGKLSDKTWVQVEEIDNPYEVVTMVPFVTRPDFLGYGRSDLDELGPVIGRIETLTVNTDLAIELGAFRQKWATGLEIPVDDEDQPVEPFKAALDRLWVSEDPDTRFGAFDYTDVRPYLQAISDAIGQLSAVSRIPTLYFNMDSLSNPPSAASLEASETGLINKVRERMDRYSESWEEVAQLVAIIANVTAEPGELATQWKDPRTQSDAQTVDAAVKLYSIEVPWESVMEYLGYTPTAIDRMKAMRASDTFNRLLNTQLNNATNLVSDTQETTEAVASADEDE